MRVVLRPHAHSNRPTTIMDCLLIHAGSLVACYGLFQGVSNYYDWARLVKTPAQHYNDLLATVALGTIPELFRQLVNPHCKEPRSCDIVWQSIGMVAGTIGFGVMHAHPSLQRLTLANVETWPRELWIGLGAAGSMVAVAALWQFLPKIEQATEVNLATGLVAFGLIYAGAHIIAQTQNEDLNEEARLMRQWPQAEVHPHHWQVFWASALILAGLRDSAGVAFVRGLSLGAFVHGMSQYGPDPLLEQSCMPRFMASNAPNPSKASNAPNPSNPSKAPNPSKASKLENKAENGKRDKKM